MNRILIVEDDPGISAGLAAFLKGEGYACVCAGSRAGALAELEKGKFDLTLLDISLPDGSGYTVCGAAGEKGVPVIFLTASADELSVVAGLEMGAEDYIAKPFRPLELLSRIKAALRRRSGSGTVRFLDLTLDTARGTVFRGGEEIFLSALEYRLLLVFANSRGAVLSRDRLLDEIFDAGGEFVNDNTLSVYIGRLREKLGEDAIRTVRGMGYRLGE